jgi:ATP-dependent protease ClpP protease subunit
MKAILLTIGLLFGLVAHAALDLTPKNTITLRGEIGPSSVDAVAKKLMKLDSERGDADYPLFLVLDTPGGSIEDGELLIEIAKTIRNLHTITIFAASMGSAIVEALPGHRMILDSGMLMFHRAKAGTQGQANDGELEVRVQMIRDTVQRLEERNAKRMSMEISEYKKAIKDELWLPSEKAVQQHAADFRVEVKCSKELAESKSVQTISMFIFSIDVSFSDCPLLRSGSVVQPESEDMYNKYKEQLKLKYDYLN